MFISRKELQELREEIASLKKEIASLKKSASFWVCEARSQRLEYPYEEVAHKLPNSEAIILLAKHVGVRFRLKRGPGNHTVLEPIETKT